MKSIREQMTKQLMSFMINLLFMLKVFIIEQIFLMAFSYSYTIKYLYTIVVRYPTHPQPVALTMRVWVWSQVRI